MNTEFFNVDEEMRWYSVGSDFRLNKIQHKPHKQHKGRSVNKRSKKGKLLATFISIKAAADAVSVTDSSIRNAILGTDNYHLCKGFIWEYADSPKESYERKPKKKCKTARPVVKMTKNGEEIARFESLRAAAKDVSVRPSAIRKTLIGNQLTTKGFKYKYA